MSVLQLNDVQRRVLEELYRRNCVMTLSEIHVFTGDKWTHVQTAVDLLTLPMKLVRHVPERGWRISRKGIKHVHDHRDKTAHVYVERADFEPGRRTIRISSEFMQLFLTGQLKICGHKSSAPIDLNIIDSTFCSETAVLELICESREWKDEIDPNTGRPSSFAVKFTDNKSTV